MDSSLVRVPQTSNLTSDIDRFLHSNQWPQYDGYQPLDKDKSEIRVLRAFFAVDYDVLCITISHASLRADPPPIYTAVSYCWGPPDETNIVLIDGQKVRIRASLHHMTSTLCANGQTENFWLDSICINQRDVVERNWQVRLMGELYSKAMSVDIWLGSADVCSEYLFSYAENQESIANLTENIQLLIKKYLTECIAELFKRPYWSRLWVVQEMGQARALNVWCGNRYLP